MEGIHNFAAFLGGLSFVLFFIGLISPEKVIWFGKNKTRINVLKIYGSAIILLMIIMSITPKPVSETYEEGLSDFRSGNFEQAVSHLSSVKDRKEDYKDTNKYLTKAQQLGSDSYKRAQWFYNKAEKASRLGNFEKAIELASSGLDTFNESEIDAKSKKILSNIREVLNTAKKYEESFGDKIYVKGDKVNIRKGPSTEYDPIRSVERGDKLYKIREKNGWFQVENTDNEFGWIYGPLTMGSKEWEAQKKAEQRRSVAKSVAYAAAKNVIRRRLKSPSTADFPFFSVGHTKYIGDKTYLIRSYVDAQNSFGATVRINYSVKLKNTKDEWDVLNVRMQER